MSEFVRKFTGVVFSRWIIPPGSRNREMMRDAFNLLSPKQSSFSLCGFSPMPLPAVVSEKEYSSYFRQWLVKCLRAAFQLRFKVTSSAGAAGAIPLHLTALLEPGTRYPGREKYLHSTSLKQPCTPKQEPGHFIQPEDPLLYTNTYKIHSLKDTVLRSYISQNLFPTG